MQFNFLNGLKKANLRYNGQLPKFLIYNIFIYWCNLGINIGSEQNKLRPVLVLRTFKNSPICTVLSLTTKRLQDGFWFHIDLEKIDSTVLAEQLKVVSKIRITNPYRKKGIRQSMSRKGNCLDNACAENFFGILKSELYYIKEKEYKNIEELEKDIIEYIEYYNNRRIKSKLKGMSPVQYREHSMLVA